MTCNRILSLGKVFLKELTIKTSQFNNSKLNKYTYFFLLMFEMQQAYPIPIIVSVHFLQLFIQYAVYTRYCMNIFMSYTA